MSDPQRLNPFSPGTSPTLPDDPEEQPEEDLQGLQELAGHADPALRKLAILRSGVDTDTDLGRQFAEALERPWTPETSTDPAYLHAKAQLADSALRKVALYESGVDLDHPAGKMFVRALEKSDRWKESIPDPADIA